MNLTSIDGLLLKKMFIAGANELNKNKQLVDSLNVFPVPDGDTGTNMSLTVLAAARECEKNNVEDVSEVGKLISSGSLRGARGNSGVIVSQLIRGFAKGIENKKSVNAMEIALAMEKGVETAYKAVMKPKEGTILTVAKACAESAMRAVEEIDDISLVLKKVIEDGNDMLSKTTDMLLALKQANVVDAGGKGLMCILEGAYKSLSVSGDIKVDAPMEGKTVDFSALNAVHDAEITFGYCTEFFINVPNVPQDTVKDLKAYLENIGDSIVVVENEEIVKVHVHTDHPGQALEKALSIGSLSGLKIDNMREQHTSKIDFSTSESNYTVKQNKEKKKIGFVAISAGSGLNDVLENLGVDEIIEGGQTMNPSTEDIIKAVNNVNAENVIILPNNKNIILAAEQAAEFTEDKKVYVVPSKSVPEGIAAMFNNDSTAEVSDILTGMNESIGNVTTAMLTYAVRDTKIGDTEIKEGDFLGMVGGDIKVVSPTLEEAAKELIKVSVDEDKEVVTIYYGSETTEEDAQKLASFVEEEFSDCEVEVISGGQPIYYYIISVE